MTPSHSEGRTYRFDHSAQCIAVAPSDHEFAALVQKWSEGGAVRKWNGTFTNVACSETGSTPSVATPLATAAGGVAGAGADEAAGGAAAAPVLWIGADGMETLPAYLAAGLKVVQPMWVSRVERVQKGDGSGQSGDSWALHGGQKQLGSFDHLVVAHNGKCAFNLMKASAKIPLSNQESARGRNPSVTSRCGLVQHNATQHNTTQHSTYNTTRICSRALMGAVAGLPLPASADACVPF